MTNNFGAAFRDHVYGVQVTHPAGQYQPSGVLLVKYSWNLLGNNAIRHSGSKPYTRKPPRASEWNELHPDATPRSEDRGAYRVVSVRVNDSGFRSTYAVEVQAAVGFEFADETFTVRVDAPEGFDQAVRRAVRKSVERAGEWNAENPDAITPRLEDADAYRVVVVRVGVDR